VTPEEEVARLQSELIGAIRQKDRPTCERLIAADFSQVKPGSDHQIEVVLREQWLDDALRDAAEPVTMTDSVVSQHGVVVVATVLWLNGEERHSSTDIWQRNDTGNWQLTERHGV
jgi:hypothetical protein